MVQRTALEVWAVLASSWLEKPWDRVTVPRNAAQEEPRFLDMTPTGALTSRGPLFKGGTVYGVGESVCQPCI